MPCSFLPLPLPLPVSAHSTQPSAIQGGLLLLEPAQLGHCGQRKSILRLCAAPVHHPHPDQDPDPDPDPDPARPNPHPRFSTSLFTLSPLLSRTRYEPVTSLVFRHLARTDIDISLPPEFVDFSRAVMLMDFKPLSRRSFGLV